MPRLGRAFAHHNDSNILAFFDVLEPTIKSRLCLNALTLSHFIWLKKCLTNFGNKFRQQVWMLCGNMCFAFFRQFNIALEMRTRKEFRSYTLNPNFPGFIIPRGSNVRFKLSKIGNASPYCSRIKRPSFKPMP